MKKFTWLLLPILFVLLAGCKQKPVVPVSFSPPDNSFTISMLGTPKSVPMPNAANFNGGGMYALDHLVDGQLFIAGYFDLKDTPTNHMSDNLDRFRDNVMQGGKNTLLSEDTIRVDGNTGRDLRLQNTSGRTIHIRFVLVGMRVYLVQVVSEPNIKDDTPVSTAFFDSFHINS